MDFTTRFKKILFSLVPYNAMRFIKKHFTKNYLFFGKSSHNTGTYLLNRNTTDFPSFGSYSELGSDISEGFEKTFREYRAHKGFMREYILECKDCFIEPQFGWGIDAQTN